MRKTLTTLFAVAALAFGSVGMVAAGSPFASPPGNDGDLCHGANQETCRPDPQPSHGADCDPHGNNPDGNDDHCGGTDPSTQPTDSPTSEPSVTPSVAPTPSADPTTAPSSKPSSGTRTIAPSQPNTATAASGAVVSRPASSMLLLLASLLSLLTGSLVLTKPRRR